MYPQGPRGYSSRWVAAEIGVNALSQRGVDISTAQREHGRGDKSAVEDGPVFQRHRNGEIESTMIWV